MFVRRLLPVVVVVFVGWEILVVGATAQTSPAKARFPRAKPPVFDRRQVDRVFFDDVFRRTVGERLRKKPPAPSATADSGIPPKSGALATASATPGQWSTIISATTLEDEVKALKLAVDQVVTTPGAFAGSGYKEARVHFSLLALLFDIIANYDGEVRWKSDAAAARDGFARAAANLKAGGSIQVYNEAKKRKQDLADLVGGSRLPDPANAEPGEQVWADRVPLMQLLEQRLEANLKKWTASEAEFRTQAEALRHESELTAVIGRALTRPGMEDSEESEYQIFAHLLEQGAINVAAAVTRKDPAAARNAMADISRSCSDCHEDYR
jgi:hypothetical protein